MINDHIVAELVRFRNSGGRAYYALQIDAPWGAGKTEFIRAFIEQKLVSSGFEDPLNDVPVAIYISLFDARSIADLDRSLATQFNLDDLGPFGQLASTLIDGAGLYHGLGELVREKKSSATARRLALALERFKRNNGLLIFDDVERSRVPLKDALGYINRFVDKEGFKVVLITNESELNNHKGFDDEQKNISDFKEFKEKLVGRTLTLSPEPYKAYTSFTATTCAPDAQRITIDNRDAVVRMLQDAGRQNLRSLRIGVEAFDRLVMDFCSDWRNNDVAMKEVLLGCIYVALEIRAGTPLDVIKNPTLLSSKLPLANKDQSDYPKYTEAMRIVTTYGNHFILPVPPIPLEYLVEFIAEGHLYRNEIYKSMSESPFIIGPSAAPPWRVLMDIWKLDIETSRATVARVREQFDNFEINDPGVLLHLAGIMLWRSDRGDLSISNGVPVKDFIQKYLSDLERNSVELDIESFPELMSAFGYRVTGSDSNRKELNMIHSLIRDATFRLSSERLSRVRDELMRKLRQPARNLSDMNFSPELRSSLNFPIFANWDASFYADLVMRDQGFDHAALQWLIDDRYGFRSILPLLSEYKWVVQLRDELQVRIDRVEPPFKLFWGEFTNKTMENIFTRFDKAMNATQDPNGISF